MRALYLAMLAAALTMIGGCAQPFLVEPALPHAPEGPVVENPVYVPLGPDAYAAVYEKVFDVTANYFEIAYANRYDGRIETFPRIAPGFEQPWKPGNPDFRGRLWATWQTLRHRAFILIQPADDGGFFVQVTVFRELEDLAKPLRQTAGGAAFRSDNTVDRQFEVIDPTVFEHTWIPLGRDTELEQAILRKIKDCM